VPAARAGGAARPTNLAYWGALPGESAWPTLTAPPGGAGDSDGGDGGDGAAEGPRAHGLEINAVDGNSGEIVRGLRLKVLAQAIEVLSGLEKCEGGLVVGSVYADDDLAEFLKPRIGGSQLAAQFPVLFQS